MWAFTGSLINSGTLMEEYTAMRPDGCHDVYPNFFPILLTAPEFASNVSGPFSLRIPSNICRELRICYCRCDNHHTGLRFRDFAAVVRIGADFPQVLDCIVCCDGQYFPARDLICLSGLLNRRDCHVRLPSRLAGSGAGRCRRILPAVRSATFEKRTAARRAIPFSRRIVS